MITEEQFKTCAKAYFPDCEFEKRKGYSYPYDIIKFKHKIFTIKFIDSAVIINRGYDHYPYICFCEEHLCSVLKKVKNYPNWTRK